MLCGKDSDKIKKPATKRNKIGNLIDSINLLSERQVESAHFFVKHNTSTCQEYQLRDTYK